MSDKKTVRAEVRDFLVHKIHVECSQHGLHVDKAKILPLVDKAYEDNGIEVLGAESAPVTDTRVSGKKGKK